jgi:hypothetical protein
MPKATFNKTVTVDKKKDKPCSQQRMVSRLRRRYTRVARYGKVYAAYLQIDHQGFCVVDDTTKKRANWFRDNLAVALERMLAANAPISGGAQDV